MPDDTGPPPGPAPSGPAPSGPAPSGPTPSLGVPAPRRPAVPTPLRVASEVCARLLVLAFGLAVLVFLVIQLRVVVIPVAIAVLLAALLAPLVHWLTAHRVPRGPATVIVLVGGLALLGALMTFVVNTLVSGFSGLAGQLGTAVESMQRLLTASPFNLQLESLQDLPAQLGRTLQANQQAFTSGALSTAATVTEVLAGFALALFSLIFLLYDGRRIWGFVQKLAPAARRARVDVAGRRAFASLVGYTRATVLVAIVDATGIGIGLWIVGVPLAFPLAALVFLGAFVPTVGAVVTGFIAVLIALVANGIVPALIVLAIVIGVQQLEGHVLQPLLLGRAVALHPLAVTLAVAAGVVVAGIAGALLAVPLLAVLTSAVRSLAAAHEPDASEVDALDPAQGHPPEVPVPAVAPGSSTEPLTGSAAAPAAPGAGSGDRGQSDACDT
ncbi:putative PurR-regulated permease PerM [Pseudonocardia sediminis]|uniref:Putative PurR-regulated permease PerM n=1 Tax=Pseudonocardia sediminis TaxID=1397368 RepID=A0A4Q7V5B1_PSEST|nr:AI-2E family transporter [Pseudonocardia sediminis]RZT89195.1 putative PurR-regulated permease PerM [Pseudonocardia sediminis]